MITLEAQTIYVEIQRLYKQLERLPCPERPAKGSHTGGPQYEALIIEIRTLSDRYRALTTEDDPKMQTSTSPWRAADR